MRTSRAAALLFCLVGLLIAACSSEPPPPTTPTVTPPPTATSVPPPTATPVDLAASCIDSPAELGNPGPMTRTDVEGAAVFVARLVSDADQQRVLDGLAAARTFIAREFGGVERSICLEIRADEQRAGAALTIGNRVIVFTQPGGWSRPYPWLLSRATAHEYVHVWAAEVANDFAPSNSIAYGPGWLVEGVAEYMSMRMVLEDGLAPVAEAETFTNTLLRLSQATLNDLEALPLPNAEDYATAELAVSRLMQGIDIRALQRYYEALGRRTVWPAAFAQVFGVSPAQFYQQFALEPGR